MPFLSGRSLSTLEVDGHSRLLGSEWIARFSAFFGALFAFSAIHRLIGIRFDYHDTIWMTYQPADALDGMRLWWLNFGDALLVGLRTDVLFSLVGAAVLASVGGRVAALLLVLAAIFFTANIEHVEYNYSHLTLELTRFGADPSFIAAMFNSGTLAKAALLIAVPAVTYAVLINPRLHVLRLLLVPIVSLVVFMTPSKPDILKPLWLQSHPFVRTTLASDAPRQTREIDIEALDWQPSEVADGAGYNVVLLYLEGLSQVDIENGSLEVLPRLAEQNLSFDHYIGNQLITANGLYTSLTGDLPNFLKPGLKWLALDPDSEVATKALPAQLRSLGYQTAYLQSADLAYMAKDEVMPKLGFDIVRGYSSADDYHSVNGWGIDDRAMLEHTLTFLDTLDPGRPWFVTVLTSGTHPPYNVPPDFETDAQSERDRAFRYLDDAVGHFVDELAARGRLEDTIVIVTADESRTRAPVEGLGSELSLNLLPFIVLHPSGLQGTVGTPVASSRMRDLVGELVRERPVLSEETIPPDTPIVFGNVYNNRLFWMDRKQATFLVCTTTEFLCAEFADVEDPFSQVAAASGPVFLFDDLHEAVSAREQ